ncbi:hypothetical protein IAR50_000638 [Cryptococcus sp. DSM 104548]
MPEFKPIPSEEYQPVVIKTGKTFDHRPWSRFLFSSLIPQCRIHCFGTRDMFTSKNWHVSVNTIMAATVIATELLHGGHEESVKEGFRSKVNTAIDILRQTNTINTIIPRGIELLQRMLAEEAAAAAWTQEGFWNSLAEMSEDQDLLALLLGNGSG